MPTHHVILTRAQEDNLRLGQLLDRESIPWRSVPCLATRPVRPDDAAVAVLGDEALQAIAFTSHRAVSGLLDQTGLLSRLPKLEASAVMAAVGPATADALRARDRTPGIVAEPATGLALGNALVEALPSGSRVLIPCGDRPRPELPRALEAGGLLPLPLQVYLHETVSPPTLSDPPLAVVCASPSAARTFLQSNPDRVASPFVAIGPTTADALRELGVKTVHVSPSTSPEDLVSTVKSLLNDT